MCFTREEIEAWRKHCAASTKPDDLPPTPPSLLFAQLRPASLQQNSATADANLEVEAAEPAAKKDSIIAGSSSPVQTLAQAIEDDASNNIYTSAVTAQTAASGVTQSFRTGYLGTLESHAPSTCPQLETTARAPLDHVSPSLLPSAPVPSPSSVSSKASSRLGARSSVGTIASPDTPLTSIGSSDHTGNNDVPNVDLSQDDADIPEDNFIPDEPPEQTPQEIFDYVHHLSLTAPQENGILLYNESPLVANLLFNIPDQPEGVLEAILSQILQYDLPRLGLLARSRNILHQQLNVMRIESHRRAAVFWTNMAPAPQQHQQHQQQQHQHQQQQQQLQQPQQPQQPQQAGQHQMPPQEQGNPPPPPHPYPNIPPHYLTVIASLSDAALANEIAIVNRFIDEITVRMVVTASAVVQTLGAQLDMGLLLIVMMEVKAWHGEGWYERLGFLEARDANLGDWTVGAGGGGGAGDGGEPGTQGDQAQWWGLDGLPPYLVEYALAGL